MKLFTKKEKASTVVTGEVKKINIFNFKEVEEFVFKNNKLKNKLVYVIDNRYFVPFDDGTEYINGDVREVSLTFFPQSIKRALLKKIGTTVLSQFIFKNSIFYLLENGAIFDGTKVVPKKYFKKEEYNLVVEGAEALLGDVHYNISPYLFYE